MVAYSTFCEWRHDESKLQWPPTDNRMPAVKRLHTRTSRPSGMTPMGMLKGSDSLGCEAPNEPMAACSVRACEA
jgi:hypothetical protein